MRHHQPGRRALLRRRWGRLSEEAPADVVRVSESGLRTADDLAYLRRHGVDAVLIGETFMRAAEPGKKLAALNKAVRVLLAKASPTVR